MFSIDSKDVANIKKKTIKYLRNMSVSDEIILKIKQCETITEIITEYMNRYYYTYLFSHREQFINMIHMVSQNTGNEQIKEDNNLADDFSLSLDRTEKIRNYILEQTIDSLIKDKQFLDKSNTAFLVEKSIEEKYNVLLDIVLLGIDAIKNNPFFITRFKRIINNLTED